MKAATLPSQQNLPLPVKLSSRFSTRGISVASLRPGDWLRARSRTLGHTCLVCVLQNSARLGRIELEWPQGVPSSHGWDELAPFEYLGQGRRRWWWPLLPELARKYCSEFSRP